jgi:2,4-dienoyl-CoA reductase-like NADH-dependent reductase (Old Yellow Enzyme family)
MSKLFQPLTIKSVSFKNRIAVSPMCQYSATDGFANDWHLVHLGSRATGGAGLVITEACAVNPEGRISPFDLGIWKDAHITELKRINTFIESQGAISGIQLAHAGRKGSCAAPWNGGKELSAAEGGWQVLAPSAIPFREGQALPLALSQTEIAQITDDFKKAAERSLEAGFKVIELHAAHGYLVHQFLSPLTNLRHDAYGGSFENRSRLLKEIIQSVKTVWPEHLPLFVRISATDWVEGGWNIEESVRLSEMMQQMGVDLVDCSSGGLVGHASIPVAPGYQVSFAHRIKKETGILTAAVGMITEAAQAEAILVNEEADLVLLAREFLRDPYFPVHAANALKEDIDLPVQYLRSKK